MTRITNKYRYLFSEKLMELGNLTIVALVFGQLISGKETVWIIIIFGILFSILLYAISYIFAK